MSARRPFVVLLLAALVGLVLSATPAGANVVRYVRATGDRMTGMLVLRPPNATPQLCMQSDTSTSTPWFWDRSAAALRLRTAASDTSLNCAPTAMTGQADVMTFASGGSWDNVTIAAGYRPLADGLRVRGAITASLPACGASGKGWITLDTTTNVLQYCDGTSYVAVGGTSASILADVALAGYCDTSAGCADVTDFASTQPFTGTAGAVKCRVQSNVMTAGAGTLQLNFVDVTGASTVCGHSVTAAGEAGTSCASITINPSHTYALLRNGGTGTWRANVNVRCNTQ